MAQSAAPLERDVGHPDPLDVCRATQLADGSTLVVLPVALPNGERQDSVKSLIDRVPKLPLMGAILRQLRHGIEPPTNRPPNSTIDTSPMPVTYQLRGTTIVVSLRGVYETADVRTTVLAAFADPRAAGATGMLFNVSESRSIAGRTATQVRAMADFLAQNAALFGHRLALVAGSDAAFGLMRLGAVGAEQQGVDSRVFRAVADAEVWLAGRPATA